MNRSQSRKTITKRNPVEQRTHYQNLYFCGNTFGQADWDGNPVWKNTIHSTRGPNSIVDGHPFRGSYDEDVLDASGWPCKKGWQWVISAGEVPLLPLNTPIHCSCETDIGHAFPISGSNDCTFTNTVLQSDGKTWLFDLTLTGITSIMVPSSQGNGAVRNIKIPQPGYNLITMEQGSKLKPNFLQFYSQLCGVRLMGAQGTNEGSNWDTTMGHWENRLTGSTMVAGWSRSTPGGSVSGMPLDVLIEQINEICDVPGAMLKKVMVNVYHTANEDYVRNLAREIRDTLNKDLIVYVEFSNEVWNYQFNQAAYVYNLSTNIENINNYKLSYDGDTDLNVVRFRMYAYLCYWVKTIFAEVWAEKPGYRPNFRMTLAGMYAMPGWYRNMIEYLEYYTGEPFNSNFYSFTAAPYFASNDVNYGYQTLPGGLTPNNIITACNNTNAHYQRSTTSNSGNLVDVSLPFHKELAVYYDTNFHWYEGGWGYQEQPNQYAPIFLEAMRDPRWKDVVYNYIKMNIICGVEELFWLMFVPGTWFTNNTNNWAITDSFPDLSYEIQGYRDACNEIILTPETIHATNKFPLNIGDTFSMPCDVAIATKNDESGNFTQTYFMDVKVGREGYVSYPSVFWNFYTQISPRMWYCNIAPGEKKNIYFSTYVPYAGTYSIDIYGYGGKYLVYTKQLPKVNTNGVSIIDGGAKTPSSPIFTDPNDTSSLLYDNIASGRTIINFFSKKKGDAQYVKKAQWDLPIVGTPILPQKSRTPAQSVYLEAGWHVMNFQLHMQDLSHLESGRVIEVLIHTPGSGYTNPTVIFPAPLTGGVQVTGTVYIGVDPVTGISNGTIGYISIDNSGNNYTTAVSGYFNTDLNNGQAGNFFPITITDPTGIGAVAYCKFNPKDSGYSITYKTDSFGNIEIDPITGNSIILSQPPIGLQCGLQKFVITKTG